MRHKFLINSLYVIYWYPPQLEVSIYTYLLLANFLLKEILKHLIDYGISYLENITPKMMVFSIFIPPKLNCYHLAL